MAPTLIQYSNSLLKHKVLFGSDYPLLTPERWMADFEKIGIKVKLAGAAGAAGAEGTHRRRNAKAKGQMTND